MTEDTDLTHPLPELHEQENQDLSSPGITAPRSVRKGEEIVPPRGKLFGYNWLDKISPDRESDIVRVQFKNTRSGFYRNVQKIDLRIGDMVAVEAAPGHDIGEVVMVGPLVKVQMKKARVEDNEEIKKVFRIARQNDLEKYEEAKSREHDTMIRSRKIAEDLGLDMKIGDVEYQGDGSKAIFYYIANERVDFRKLIRILADTFRIRIEMKQIGARQEAGRIGGIGPCGRPLCCASWLTHFVSVGTSAARFQDISMNPQKLAGQCSKLKCCLNFEVDTYMESSKKCPPKDVTLETVDGTFYLFKNDILRHLSTYSSDKNVAANLTTIPSRRAFEIMALNKQGVKVDTLEDKNHKDSTKHEFIEIVGQDSLTRFDKSKKKKKKKNKNPKSDDRQEKPETGQKQAKNQNSRPNKKNNQTATDNADLQHKKRNQENRRRKNNKEKSEQSAQ